MRLKLIGLFIFTAALGLWARQGSDRQNTGEPDEIIMEIETDPASQPSESSADSLPPVDQAPVLLNFVKAGYPADLLKKGIQGTVSLELLVDETGRVDSVRVLRGIHPVLDSSAAAAARDFIFSPALAGDDSVAVLLQYDYRFSATDEIDTIPDVVNFSGVILERGSRARVPYAVISLKFPDTTYAKSLPLPFGAYLEKIAGLYDQRLEDGRLITESDSSGEFRFHSLPPCSVETTVLLSGYEKFVTKELIIPDKETVAKYYVQRRLYGDYEIVVYGKAEEKEVNKRELTIQEVRRIPGLGGDAIRVVQALPGVARPTLGLGDVIVRGAPSWDSRYYLDGIELPLLYHFGGLKSIYNSEALQSIDFYPGGFGTRYGGAVAGVIEINGRETKKDRIHTQLDISNIDGSMFIEGPVNDKLSVLVSGRRSFIGELLGLAVKLVEDRFPATLSPFYWDYLMRTDYKLSAGNDLFLTLFGSRDSLAIIFPDTRIGSEEVSSATDRMGMNTTFHMGILGWDWDSGKRLKNSLRFGLTKVRSSMSVFGFFRQEQGITGSHLRNQLTYTINERFAASLGADIQTNWIDLMLVIPGGRGAFIRDTCENWLFGVVGGYLNLEWKPTENLQIIPGLRYDYFPELIHDGSVVPEFWDYRKYDKWKGFSGEPSLRLNARYKINGEHTVKAAIGNYSQTPQPIGQVIHKVWGDPSLPATKAAHYVAGHEWAIGSRLDSDVQFYYNKQWNIPRYALGSDLSNPEALWLSDETGRMYGMELMLRYPQRERFFGWIAYTLSKSERYDPHKKRWAVYDKDQTHNFQALGSWKLKKGWESGFRLRYVTGDPTTPVTGVIENENDNYFMPEYGEKNSSRVGPFFQLDLRADKRFIFNKWILSFYLDLQNISWFLYKSPEIEIYNYDYTRKTAFSMFPMLATGVKAEL